MSFHFKPLHQALLNRMWQDIMDVKEAISMHYTLRMTYKDAISSSMVRLLAVAPETAPIPRQHSLPHRRGWVDACPDGTRVCGVEVPVPDQESLCILLRHLEHKIKVLAGCLFSEPAELNGFVKRPLWEHQWTCSRITRLWRVHAAASLFHHRTLAFPATSYS